MVNSQATCTFNILHLIAQLWDHLDVTEPSYNRSFNSRELCECR